MRNSNYMRREVESFLVIWWLALCSVGGMLAQAFGVGS